MMSKKKYISTGAIPLSIDIMDKGVLKTFDFRGGMKHPIFIPPSYITENEEEQQLLESCPSFNRFFKLEESFDIPEFREDAIIEKEPEIKEITFPNVQDAKTWLNREHGVPFTKTKNKAKVIAEASNLGYNVQFESDNK
jgi:hypothetical protein